MGEVIVGETYKILSKALSWYGPKPFVTFETVEECTSSFAGTMDAYFETFTGAFMIDSRGIDLEDEMDIVQLGAFYGNFGLSYVHNTYPFYVLGEEYGAEMEPSPALYKPDVPEFALAAAKGEYKAVGEAFTEEYGEYFKGGK